MKATRSLVVAALAAAGLAAGTAAQAALMVTGSARATDGASDAVIAAAIVAPNNMRRIFLTPPCSLSMIARHRRLSIFRK